MIALLISLLPIRPPEYEEDQITDLYEREIAADLIREAALLKLRDEVPHGIAVRVDDFKERENGMTYIAATLFVEREFAKGNRDRRGRKNDEADRHRRPQTDRGDGRTQGVFGVAREGGKRLAQ